MKIAIQVKPNSRTNEVQKREDGTYVVRVSVPAIEGRANEKVIELLSEFFGTPKRNIRISSGNRGRHKIIEIA